MAAKQMPPGGRAHQTPGDQRPPIKPGLLSDHGQAMGFGIQVFPSTLQPAEAGDAPTPQGSPGS
jgi:hypothetical protein